MRQSNLLSSLETSRKFLHCLISTISCIHNVNWSILLGPHVAEDGDEAISNEDAVY